MPDQALGGLCSVCALEAAIAGGDPAEPDAAAAQGRLLLDDLPLEEGESNAIRLGKYVLHEPLGSGGMGVVYKAWQTDLQRWVAIKLLPVGSLDLREARERFRREALAVARLQHPHIVAIHDLGDAQQRPYLVMEYVAGPSLARLAGDLLATPERGARYVQAAAEAVQAAHDSGVLHRDLKPSNILVGADDRVRITDFGLARIQEERGDLTRSGQLVGTPAYLAPEQLADGPGGVTARSDVYSLGAVLYHLLTGRPPFVAASVAAVLRQVTHLDPPAPTLLNPLVPADLAAICLHCLRKSPNERYATAAELAADLGRFLARREVRARPPSWPSRLRRWSVLNPGWATAAGLGLLLLGILGGAGALKLREQWQIYQQHLAAGQEAADRDAMRQYAQRIEGALRALEINDPRTAVKLLELTPPTVRGWEFHLLHSLQSGQHRQWAAHDDGISSLATDPAGERIASGDWRGHLRLWQAADGRLLRQHRLHQRQILAIRFSPDNRRLATCGDDGTACLFDLDTGEVTARFDAGLSLLGVAWVDQDAILTANENGQVQLWRVSQPEHPETRFDAGSPLRSFAVDPSHPRFACGDVLGRIHLGPLVDPSPPTPTSAATPTPARPAPWEAHAGAVFSLAWNPAGDLLASASSTGQIRLWTPASGQLRRTLQETGGAVRDLAWSADGTCLAAAGDDWTVRVWEVDDPAPPEIIQNHEAVVFAVRFLGNQRLLVSGGRDRLLRVYPLPQGVLSEAFRLDQPGGVLRLRFAHQSPWWVTGGTEGELRRQGPVPGKVTWDHTSEQGRVTALTISPDDQWIISAGTRGQIEIRSSADGQLQRRLDVGLQPVRCLAVHPAGRLLAVGGDDRVARVFDLPSGELRRSFPEHSARIGRIAFSAEGDCLLLSGADNRLVLWSLNADTHPSPRYLPVVLDDFDVGPDRRVVTVDHVAGAYVWVLPELTALAKAEHPRTGLRAVAFDPTGARYVTVDTLGELRVWDARTGIGLLALPLPAGRVRDLQFSPDGRRLAVVTMRGAIQILPAEG